MIWRATSYVLKRKNSEFCYWNVNKIRCVLQVACSVPELEINSLVIHYRASLFNLWTLFSSLLSFLKKACTWYLWDPFLCLTSGAANREPSRTRQPHVTMFQSNWNERQGPCLGGPGYLVFKVCVVQEDVSVAAYVNWWMVSPVQASLVQTWAT